MGEAQVTVFDPEFNRAIKVQTTDDRITSNAGAVLLRELDHLLGLVESLSEKIIDPRDADRISLHHQRVVARTSLRLGTGI